MVATSDLDKIKETPTSFVVFGATGNLSKKRIFPSLYKLSKNNLLPKDFKIVATARTTHSSEEFREIAREMIDAPHEQSWKDFASCISYVPADVAENINLDQVENIIDEFEKEINNCSTRIFYMAIAPDIFIKAVENLGHTQMHTGCKIHDSQVNKPRIIIEKPFGTDLKSAQDLGKKLSEYFTQDQIYRIDHYLGKETVQNMFAFRFGNELFEPIWNNKYIDNVQIITAEHIGVENRGDFYDKTGALRDILQNHMMQLIALTTMEEPTDFSPRAITQEKLKVLKNFQKLTKEEIEKSTVRAQYEGFQKEPKIFPESQTESYALVKFHIDNPRWQGVPFYLRTGKKLMGKVTSVIVGLKDQKHKILEGNEEKPLPNHITIQIQPNEGVGIRIVAKKPGLTTQLEPVDMEFCYKTSFDIPQPEAYERLILDVIAGDQSLFLSQEEVEESWKIIDPIRQVWNTGTPKMATYKPGTWGPEEADKLIEKDGRMWLAPLLTICKI